MVAQSRLPTRAILSFSPVGPRYGRTRPLPVSVFGYLAKGLALLPADAGGSRSLEPLLAQLRGRWHTVRSGSGVPNRIAG